VLGRDRIQYKSTDQVRAMRRAGLVVGETLELLRGTVRPGLTTSDLDAVAEKHIRAAGATPSFLGYHGFPATLCVSVNDEVVLTAIDGGRERLAALRAPFAPLD
jgi:methionyl aminopeptidase